MTRCGRCGGVLPPAAVTGRPRRYCSAACRQSAFARRQRRSPRHEWWTPEPLRQLVTATIDPVLDAAACDRSTLAPDWLGPRHHEPQRQDALAFRDWADVCPEPGWVWLNPPYNPTALMGRFLEVAHATAKAGIPVMALVPASVGTRWWEQRVESVAQSSWVIPRRLTYTGPHSVGDPAPWPSALVVYSPKGTKRIARDVIGEFQAGWRRP